MGFLRLLFIIWIIGFLVLAAVATSNYLFGIESFPERGDRWVSRLRVSLLWPLALLSSAGRARLRNG